MDDIFKNLLDKYAFIRNPMQVKMTIVLGTLIIFWQDYF